MELMLRSIRYDERSSAGLSAYLGLLCAGYAALTVWYFWVDYFSFAANAKVMLVDRAGFMVPTPFEGVWTNLSPWRIVGAIAAVCLLASSATALAHGRPHARMLTAFTLWGVLLPQSLWFVELSIDWYGGAQIGFVFAAAIALVAWPTTQLVRSLAPSKRVPTPGGLATFGASVLLAWIAFGATEFLDHSYQLLSDGTYIAALITVPLAVSAAAGALTHQLWSMPVGALAAVFGGLIPLGFATSPYLTTGGVADEIVFAMAGTPANAVLIATLPMVLLAWIWTPALISAAARPRPRQTPGF